MLLLCLELISTLSVQSEIFGIFPAWKSLDEEPGAQNNSLAERDPFYNAPETMSRLPQNREGLEL